MVDLWAALPLTFTLADTGCQFISRLHIYQPFIYDMPNEVLPLAFSSSLTRYEERQVCDLCVEEGRTEASERQERQESIFLTESSCVAGTKMGRNGGGGEKERERIVSKRRQR